MYFDLCGLWVIVLTYIRVESIKTGGIPVKVVIMHAKVVRAVNKEAIPARRYCAAGNLNFSFVSRSALARVVREKNPYPSA